MGEKAGFIEGRPGARGRGEGAEGEKIQNGQSRDKRLEYEGGEGVQD